MAGCGSRPTFNPENGDRFGRLTILDNSLRGEPTRWNSLGHRKFLCLCDCGVEKVINARSIRNGDVKSCGCLALDSIKTVSESNKKHGVWLHPLYPTWYAMVNRCRNEKHKFFRHYGGRGISVHEAWTDGPVPFIDWIDVNLGPRPDGMTLDRIDNDGNYEPGNLRWATKSQQAKNRGRRTNPCLTGES